jgi:hypothetical protein
MRRLALVLAFIAGALIGGGIIHAVNFTVDLTQAEVDQANWAWKKEHGGSSGQYATAALFGGAVVKNDIAEFKARRQVFRIQILGEPTGYFCTNTWPGLSQGTKDTICTGTLFDVNGCTPCSADGS